MYGNSPISNPTAAQENTEIELTPEQKTVIRGSMNAIRERTDSLLPFDYEVGVNIDETPNGTTYGVAVFPPVGHGVSIQINAEEFTERTPDGVVIDTDELEIDPDQCEEIAQQLVASTILQVKQAEDDTDRPAS